MDIDEWIIITDSNQVFVNKLEHFLHLKQTTNKHSNTKNSPSGGRAEDGNIERRYTKTDLTRSHRTDTAPGV